MILNEEADRKQAVAARKIVQLEKQGAMQNECIAEMWGMLQQLMQ
jgi:hypothetical protein